MAVRLQAVRTVWLWRAAVVVAALALAASAVQAEPLQATKLSEHVHYFQGAVGQASAANQGFMSNAGIVVTSEGVVVFDTLGTPALGQGMACRVPRTSRMTRRRPRSGMGDLRTEGLIRLSSNPYQSLLTGIFR